MTVSSTSSPTSETSSPRRKQLAATYGDDLLFADGLDDAIIGLARGCGRETVVAYDYDKAVQILAEQDGWSHSDAVDWMEFNVVGAYVGPGTPIWVEIIEI